MNHAGNSRSVEVNEGIDRSNLLEEPKNADEVDIYEAGKCKYDPYFLYGFGKFGQESFGE